MTPASNQPVNDSPDCFYGRLESFVTQWGREHDEVRAIIVVGSRARIDHPADRWSDLDLLVFSTQPDALLADASWIGAFAPVWTTIVSRTAGNDPERLVLFAGGFQADVVFVPLAHLDGMARASTVPFPFHHGIRVLLDKDNMVPSSLTAAPEQYAPRLPSQDEFSGLINNFWFTAVYLAKQLLRTEMWVFHARSTSLRDLLLRMLEWQTLAEHGSKAQTWYGGRFMREWLEPSTFSMVSACWRGFDREESRQALFSTIDLFRQASERTALQCRFAYPPPIDEPAIGWILGALCNHE